MASTRVRKDHVRSVIHLALSEARINAFVVISCLEGLLAVASEGMGPASKEDSSDATDSGANSIDSKGSESEETNGATAGECQGERGVRQHASSSCSDSVLGPDCTTTNDESQSRNVFNSATVAVGSSVNSSNRVNRRGESGAALCVRLGALPAVLGCLNEHAGHKQIEPLAVRLLSVFAGDRDTSSAVRGNADVAGACTARMFPVDVVSVGGGPSSVVLGGGASDVRTLLLKDTSGGNKGRAGAGPGECGGRADDGQGLEYSSLTEEVCGKNALGRDHGRLIETTGDANSTATARVDRTSAISLAPSASAPGSCSASDTTPETYLSVRGANRTSKPITSSSSSAAAATQPISSILGSRSSSDTTVADSAEGGSHTPRRAPKSRSESSTPATTTAGRAIQLPATDLVFLLSVAVQGSPECQRLIIRSGGITAMSATLRQQASGAVEREASACRGGVGARKESGCGARLAALCLRVMEGLGQSERGRRRLLREGSVEAAIAIIGRFRWASKT